MKTGRKTVRAPFGAAVPLCGKIRRGLIKMRVQIGDLDRNLKAEDDIAEPGLVWLNVRQAPFALSGVMWDENQGCYVRMPQAGADSVSDSVGVLNRDTAGGRVRPRTNSSFLGLRAVMENSELMPHITLAGQSGFDCYRRDGDGRFVYCHTFMPRMGMKTGYASGFAADGNEAEYLIYFPLYDGVKELFLALKEGSTLSAPAPCRRAKPVVFYGSSITPGGCASRPGNSYPALLSRRLDTEFVNLGFSGSCRGEPAMARYLASLEMSVLVLDYDHNAPSPEHLQATHLPLYRTVRQAQPQLPILILSSPDIRLRGGIWQQRREIVRRTYETARAEGDRNVYWIGGETLFGEDGWDGCTVDGTHPNDLGFYRMACRIETVLAPLLP